MLNFIPAPATRGQAMTAAAVGACVGLAIGSAYVAGALARASVEDAQARLVARSVAPPPATPERAGRAALAAPALAPARQAILQTASLRGSAAPARDLECLSQAVYYEARGEEERGRKAVAQVVLNRTRQPRYPRSICGVVFQHVESRCAFSFACDGQTRRMLEPAAWRDARRIAQLALAGAVLPELRLATDFRSYGGTVPAGLARVAQIGGHVFYRWTPFRAPQAAAPRAQAPQETAPADAAQAAPAPPTLVKADGPVKSDAAAATPAA